MESLDFLTPYILLLPHLKQSTDCKSKAMIEFAIERELLSPIKFIIKFYTFVHLYPWRTGGAYSCGNGLNNLIEEDN